MAKSKIQIQAEQAAGAAEELNDHEEGHQAENIGDGQACVVGIQVLDHGGGPDGHAGTEHDHRAVHAAPPQEAADKHCDQVGRQRVAQRGKRGLDYLIDETGEGAPAAGHGEQAADDNEGHDRNQRSRDTGKALGNKFRDGAS